MISSSDILQGKVLIVTLRESISFYSGISGGFVPLILKRLGADPVIASGIIPRHRH